MLSEHSHMLTRPGLRDGSDSDEISVLHGPHVADFQRNERLSLAGCGHKLKE
jgi:hypothetical protein